VRRPFRRTSHPREELWAIKDVSFELKAGSVLGVIGQNGAGKSTLLKVLSRITEPTEGRAVMRGTVGSLLEVGTGFHPELSGRENTYLNGAILGMTRREISSKFDQIIEFAGVERMIDTPMKRYSSGMYVRLAFSVAAHLQPDILIVDEVLAVGDVAFQQKCFEKMEDVAGEGRTVVFVTHNLAAVEHLCPRSILLESGQVVADGGTDAVVAQYLATASGSDVVQLSDREDHRGNGLVRTTSMSMRSATGAPRTGEPLEIEIAYEGRSSGDLENVAVALAIDTVYGQRITTLGTELAGTAFDRLPARGTLTCALPSLSLNEGRYHVTLYITLSGVVADWVVKAGILNVHAGDYFDSGRSLEPHDGLVVVPQAWRAD
jgi:lipopolysaccharide transport system ATP-binding protein